MKTLLIAPSPLTPRAAQLRDALNAEHLTTPGSTTITIWAAPWTRTDPLPAEGAGVHVMDLHGAIAACPGAGAAAQSEWCASVAALCRGASLALAGSAAELGFWSAQFDRHAVNCPLTVVPYALTPPPSAPPPSTTGPALAIAGPWIADPALRPMLDAALAWAAGTGTPVSRGPAADPSGALAIAALAPPTTPPSMLLDLRRDTPAERVSTPTWVIDALAAGIPVLTTVDGPLGQAIATAGAGRILTTAFLPPPDGAPSAATSLTHATPPAAAPAATLHAALARAATRDAATRATWCAPGPLQIAPLGRVLVLSDEADTLAAVRVRLPFDTLLRRGAITGYAVLHKGTLGADSGTQHRFDTIWVHRSAEPSTRLLLELLGRPFVYDIDDNLLASPRYRPPFHPVAMATTKDFLRRATVISCATARLAQLLAARLRHNLSARLLVTQNLAASSPAPRKPGIPNAVIWASSDRPALAASADAIARAVRDHCLAYQTKLVCIGAEPHDALRVPGLDLEHIPVVPHAEYRARLRAMSPAVLVCPLETGADPDTQDFIDGKSDIKLIEALSDGLVGVFSRAAPYLDSTLPGAILTENTYDAWLAGLEAARATCIAPAASVAWPEDRDANQFGLAPWAAALTRARLDVPLTVAELMHAIQEVRTLQARPIPPEEFDEDDYLANYPDVRDAVAARQLPSGYAHYAGPGQVEGRYGRKRTTPEALGEAWWATLLHELGRLEAASSSRATALAGFERRLALRRALAARIPR